MPRFGFATSMQCERVPGDDWTTHLDDFSNHQFGTHGLLEWSSVELSFKPIVLQRN